jgi:hypothetical protein
MNDQTNDWGWFDTASGSAPASYALAFDKNQLATIITRFFRSSEGAYLLDYLRAITVERTLGPDASDNLLRHLEGQRQLVSMLINLADRGSNEPDQNTHI